MQFELRTLCADAEIAARVVGQIFQFINIVKVRPYTDEGFKAKVLKTAQDLMSKLSSVRLHKKNFVRRYKEREEYHDSRDPQSGGEAFHVQSEPDLVGEVETFLSQVKSSLDISAKFLIPCAGLGERKAETFSDAGIGVIKQLRRPHIEAQSLKERLDILISCIEWNHGKWMQEVVGARTNTVHREATQGLAFRFASAEHGKPTLLVPTVRFAGHELTYPDFLVVVERLLFDFCREFIALSLYLKAPAFMVLQELSSNEAIKAWNMQAAEHIRWGLALRSTPQ